MSEDLVQCFLDTETTGISTKDNHKIIEIGVVKVVNRQFTQEIFHCYLNPERDIDKGAQAVHGLSAEFLQDKPLFADVYHDFMNFIQGSQLLMHNASFDVGFLDHEINLINRGYKIYDNFDVIDTLSVAKKKYPGQKNNLDSLCRRLGVDLSKRDLHGALLDADLLARVYLLMTSSQSEIFIQPKEDSKTLHASSAVIKIKEVEVSTKDYQSHKDYIDRIT